MSDVVEDKVDTEIAVKQLLQDIGKVEINEMTLYVFEKMLELLNNVPNQFEAIAVARLALLGSVTNLVKQNAELTSLLQGLCEKFAVSVKVTAVNNERVYEHDLAIVKNSQYDLVTLQRGIATLTAKMDIIVNTGSDKDSAIVNHKNTISNLTEDLARANNRIKEYANVPPPPMVEKPYRLARFYVKDGVARSSYIAKCPENGYKVTRRLKEALVWETADKAVERLVHLTQNYSDYSISNIHQYGLITIHYIVNNMTSVDPNLQLALATARAIVEKNIKE
jgi:hypothetical protein